MRPQSDFTVGADFVGRFERLDRDFARACERVRIAAALAHKNASQHRPYATYYNDWSRSFVAARYASDVETFGYRFEAA